MQSAPRHAPSHSHGVFGGGISSDRGCPPNHRSAASSAPQASRSDAATGRTRTSSTEPDVPRRAVARKPERSRSTACRSQGRRGTPPYDERDTRIHDCLDHRLRRPLCSLHARREARTSAHRRRRPGRSARLRRLRRLRLAPRPGRHPPDPVLLSRPSLAPSPAKRRQPGESLTNTCSQR